MLAGKLAVRQKNGWSGYAMAVGDAGAIFYSTNGKNWSNKNTLNQWGSAQLLYIMNDGAGHWVTCGVSGLLMYSNDNGTNWTTVTTGTTEKLYAIKYSPTMSPAWLCVGDNGVSLTSTDGITWTLTVGSAARDLIGLTTNGSLWVANDGSSVASVWTSTNGTTWTERALSTTVISSPYLTQGIAYGNGVFVVLLSNSTGTLTDVQTSTDGVTWTSHGSPTNGESSRAYNLQFINGKFRCVSYTGNSIYTSTDGVTWTKEVAGTLQFNLDDSPVQHQEAQAFSVDSKGNKIFLIAGGSVTASSCIINGNDGLSFQFANGIANAGTRAIYAYTNS